MTLPETLELSLPGGRVLRYCLYGPAGGIPVISHSGTPSTRWRRPAQLEAMDRGGLRHLVYDRPGYGGSTRHPGRTVAGAAADAEALADAHGWSRFAIFGGSGGGPHALACAALLGDRVTRCAVLSGVKPGSATPTPEPELRARLAEVAAGVIGKAEAGGPETPFEPGPPARTDPDAMARLRATFVEGTDGWVDDTLAFARPWGFDPATITVPVGIWRGTDDPVVPAEHSEWLLTHIPDAKGHVYTGGHLPGAGTYGEIYDWLRG